MDAPKKDDFFSDCPYLEGIPGADQKHSMVHVGSTYDSKAGQGDLPRRPRSAARRKFKDFDRQSDTGGDIAAVEYIDRDRNQGSASASSACGSKAGLSDHSRGPRSAATERVKRVRRKLNDFDRKQADAPTMKGISISVKQEIVNTGDEPVAVTDYQGLQHISDGQAQSTSHAGSTCDSRACLRGHTRALRGSAMDAAKKEDFSIKVKQEIMDYEDDPHPATHAVIECPVLGGIPGDKKHSMAHVGNTYDSRAGQGDLPCGPQSAAPKRVKGARRKFDRQSGTGGDIAAVEYIDGDQNQGTAHTSNMCDSAAGLRALTRGVRCSAMGVANMDFPFTVNQEIMGSGDGRDVGSNCSTLQHVPADQTRRMAQSDTPRCPRSTATKRVKRDRRKNSEYEKQPDVGGDSAALQHIAGIRTADESRGTARTSSTCGSRAGLSDLRRGVRSSAMDVSNMMDFPITVKQEIMMDSGEEPDVGSNYSVLQHSPPANQRQRVAHARSTCDLRAGQSEPPRGPRSTATRRVERARRKSSNSDKQPGAGGDNAALRHIAGADQTQGDARRAYDSKAGSSDHTQGVRISATEVVNVENFSIAVKREIMDSEYEPDTGVGSGHQVLHYIPDGSRAAKVVELLDNRYR